MYEISTFPFNLHNVIYSLYITNNKKMLKSGYLGLFVSFAQMKTLNILFNLPKSQFSHL